MSESDSQDTATDLSRFHSQLSFGNRALRAVWSPVWLIFFRLSPRVCFGWRRVILRLFGAKVKRNVRIYNSARVYYPPNLELGDNVVVGPHVDLYCVDKIIISENSMISQYCFLCAASHDSTKPDLPLVTAPIVIAPSVWVCADVFVGMGVTIGTGAVVGARASVFSNVESWTIVGGNPARKLKDRKMSDE